MEYDTFSKQVFRVIGIDESSTSIIKEYLHKLSEDFNVSYTKVVNDFNEYNNYVWCIEDET